MSCRIPLTYNMPEISAPETKLDKVPQMMDNGGYGSDTNPEFRPTGKRPVKRKRFVAVYSIKYALIDGHCVFTFDAELKKYLS